MQEPGNDQTRYIGFGPPGSVALPTQPFAQSAATEKIDDLKQRVIQGIEQRAKLAQQMNDSIFSFGELGVPGSRDVELRHRRAREERLHR
jgi:hypothetical protein